jgi:hypothetical protein
MTVYIYQTWLEPYSTEDSPIFVAAGEISKERQKEIAVKLLLERWGYKGNTLESINEDWGSCGGCYLKSKETTIYTE